MFAASGISLVGEHTKTVTNEIKQGGKGHVLRDNKVCKRTKWSDDDPMSLPAHDPPSTTAIGRWSCGSKRKPRPASCVQARQFQQARSKVQ